MTEKQYKIACVIGTRPEAIKMASVIFALRQHKIFTTCIISTGQHREILDEMLDIFGLVPDISLHLMKENQTLAELTGNVCLQLGNVIRQEKFDLVIAQGDTTTTFIAALTSFYLKIPFAHIEAGLRSYNMQHPFPEEMNRVFVSQIASLHFTPTDEEQDNLLREGISPDSIYVTGNTVIDALKYILTKEKQLPFALPDDKHIVLVTLHHRENFGEPLKHIFAAIVELAKINKDVYFVFPVHPNPNVKELAYAMLSDQPAIKLLQPLTYDVFVMLMKKSYIIMTDSGGIEEEAPFLGKPLVVLRDITERTKIISLGLGVLVGANKEKIIENMQKLLTDPGSYQTMVKNISPYGDGHSGAHTVKIIVDKIAELTQ